MQVAAVQVGATTKINLKRALETDPASVRFVPVTVSNPLDLAFNTTADRIPLTPHGVRVYGPNGKWTAIVGRHQDRISVK
jgi:hypothetical protein